MTLFAWIHFVFPFSCLGLFLTKIMHVPEGTLGPKCSPLDVTWTHWARTQQSINSLVYPQASKLLQNLLIEARSRLTNGCKEHLTSFYWGWMRYFTFQLTCFLFFFLSNGMNFKLGSTTDIYLGTDWIIQQAVRINRFLHCVAIHILVSAKVYVSNFRFFYIPM